MQHLQVGVSFDSVADCFWLFPAVYALTSTPSSLKCAACSVVSHRANLARSSSNAQSSGLRPPCPRPRIANFPRQNHPLKHTHSFPSRPQESSGFPLRGRASFDFVWPGRSWVDGRMFGARRHFIWKVGAPFFCEGPVLTSGCDQSLPLLMYYCGHRFSVESATELQGISMLKINLKT